MSKFKPGDEVQFTYDGQMCIGTIRQIDTENNTYSVEFGPNVPFADALHDCKGDVPNGMGWWTGEAGLTLVRKSIVVWPPEYNRTRYKQFQTKVL